VITRAAESLVSFSGWILLRKVSVWGADISLIDITQGQKKVQSLPSVMMTALLLNTSLKSGHIEREVCYAFEAEPTVIVSRMSFLK